MIRFDIFRHFIEDSEVERMRNKYYLFRIIIVLILIFSITFSNFTIAKYDGVSNSDSESILLNDIGENTYPILHGVLKKSSGRAAKNFQFGSKYPELYRDWCCGKKQFVKNVIKEMVLMNITYVEFEVKWSDIEHDNDNWLWNSSNDSLMDLIIELTSNDLEPIILLKVNYWASGGSWAVDGIDRKGNSSYNNSGKTYAPYYYILKVKQPPRPWNSTDPGVAPAGTMDEYYEFVYNMMEQYRDYIRYYEIENDPGRINAEFLGDMYDYYTMMKEVNKARNQILNDYTLQINIINPYMSMPQGVGKSYPRFNLIDILEKFNDYKNCFDIISWHNNNFNSSWSSPLNDELENLEDDLVTIDNLFSNFGIENKTIFNTESSIPLGDISEFVKRIITDFSYNIVPFTNYISSHYERPDHGLLVETHKMITERLDSKSSVERLQFNEFERPDLYGYAIKDTSDTFYVLWSETDLARVKYGGQLVYYTSELSDAPALNIINGTRTRWESKRGITNNEFIISFLNNESFDINKIVLTNNYFNRHGQNSSAQEFEIWYSTDKTWQTANWNKINTYYSYNKGLINITHDSAIVEGYKTSWEFANLREGVDQIKIRNSLNGNNGNYTINQINNNQVLELSEEPPGADERNLSYSIDHIPSNSLKKFWFNPDFGTEPKSQYQPFVYLKSQEFYFKNNSIIKDVSLVKLIIKTNYGNPNYVSLNSFEVHRATHDLVDLSTELPGMVKVTDIYGNQTILDSSKIQLYNSPIFVESYEPFKRPDLMINTANITFNPERIIAGENFTINATISNIGIGTANVSNISFYVGSPASNGIQIGANKKIEDLTNDSQILITSSPWNLSEGEYKIYVMISNCTPEDSNLTNNLAFRTIKIYPPPTYPDLILKSSSIEFSKELPIDGEIVYINATIRNIGTTSSLSANITFHISNLTNHTNDIQIGQAKNIPALPPNGWVTITSDPWVVIEGEHNIFINISDTFPIENNISNNFANKTIVIYPIGAFKPDLQILSEYISFTPDKPVQGEAVTINVVIFNIGTKSAISSCIAFYSGNPINNGEQIGKIINISNIKSNSQISISSDPWMPNAGEYNIYVTISNTTPMETNITNNHANKIINVSIKRPELDFFIKDSDIEFSNENPIFGDLVIITARIHLQTISAYNQFFKVPVEFLIDNILITIVNVSIQSSFIDVLFNWSAKAGEHDILIKIDPNNEIAETNEQNNIASKQIFVQSKEPQKDDDEQFFERFGFLIMTGIIILIVIILIILILISRPKTTKPEAIEEEAFEEKVHDEEEPVEDKLEDEELIEEELDDGELDEVVVDEEEFIERELEEKEPEDEELDVEKIEEQEELDEKELEGEEIIEEEMKTENLKDEEFVDEGLDEEGLEDKEPDEEKPEEKEPEEDKPKKKKKQLMKLKKEKN